jgi:hypothetical protein
MWTQLLAIEWEATIRTLLPWDVGASRVLLWSSIALFVAIGLAASQVFGWFCGRLVEIVIKSRRPRP